MKYNVLKTIRLVIMTTLLTIISISIFADGGAPPPPPPPPSGHAGGDGPVGGGAPIGSGALLLLALGSIYGVRKIYLAKSDNGPNIE
jgi:hypothetical protein